MQNGTFSVEFVLDSVGEVGSAGKCGDENSNFSIGGNTQHLTNMFQVGWFNHQLAN